MPDTPRGSAATIASPDAVLICTRCERKVHRLHMHPTGSVCDECSEALADGT